MSIRQPGGSWSCPGVISVAQEVHLNWADVLESIEDYVQSVPPAEIDWKDIRRLEEAVAKLRLRKAAWEE